MKNMQNFVSFFSKNGLYIIERRKPQNMRKAGKEEEKFLNGRKNDVIAPKRVKKGQNDEIQI